VERDAGVRVRASVTGWNSTIVEAWESTPCENGEME
jgi:hypothetical protein